MVGRGGSPPAGSSERKAIAVAVDSIMSSYVQNEGLSELLGRDCFPDRSQPTKWGILQPAIQEE